MPGLEGDGMKWPGLTIVGPVHVDYYFSLTVMMMFRFKFIIQLLNSS